MRGWLAVTPPLIGTHTSSIGLIPKPQQPGKFRLVEDLFVPLGTVSMTGLTRAYVHSSMLWWIRQPRWPDKLGRGLVCLNWIIAVHTGGSPCFPILSTSWELSGKEWSTVTRPSPSGFVQPPSCSQRWQMASPVPWCPKGIPVLQH